MPKVKGNAQGIVVRGQRFHADGTADTSVMIVRPEKAKIWRGALWSAEPVEVRPEISGVFVVVLPPGTYQVETPTWSGRIVVPAEVQSVKFEDIVQRS